MASERFDALILILGGTAVLGPLAFSFTSGTPDGIEVLGQLMLLVVLIAAVKGGRRSGGVAALVASVIYVLGRIDLLTAVPVSPVLLTITLSRFAAYGLVGIVGGEMSARMRYTLAGMEDSESIDDWSRVYNQPHAAASLTRGIGRFTRYSEQFSIVVITLSPAIFSDMSALRQRRIVRAIADHIRSDVRLVDEVARLDDGRFVVFLPHTPRTGAVVVRDRIMGDLPSVLGSRPEAVSASVLSAPEDFDALNAFADSILPEQAPEEAAQSAL